MSIKATKATKEFLKNNIAKFSLIVGLYNHKKYLRKLIESLENQTYKNFEVIFVDDGSNDGTKEYFGLKPIFKFDYQYKRLWFKKGMRLAKNINQGIKVAKSEYCVFIMGDSFPEKNYLEVFNVYADKNNLLCGVRIQIDNNKAVDIDWRLKKKVIPEKDAIIINQPYNCFTGNGLVIPTLALKKYGGWDERFKKYGGDDNELVARMYYKGYVCWSLPQAILYHHWHKPQEDEAKNKKLLNKILWKYAK